MSQLTHINAAGEAHMVDVSAKAETVREARAEAVEVAERVRQQVEELKVTELPAEHPVRVSIGCAQLREGESLSELIHRADEAMYSAKRAGRNRVCRAE